MSNLVKWGGYDEETAEAEKKDLDKSNAAFMKLKVGRNVVRFLPPILGQGYGEKKNSPFRVVWTHYIRMPGKKDPISFACPNREAREMCPACMYAEQKKATGNQADSDAAYELFPKRRVYAVVINREEPEKGPQVLGFGKVVHEALVKIRKDADAGGDFTNPETGFDIIIERQGTGVKDTEYTVMPARKQSKLGNNDWIEVQPDLNGFGKVKSADEITALIRGEGDGGGGGKQGRGGDVVDAKAKRSRTAADDMDDISV